MYKSNIDYVIKSLEAKKQGSTQLLYRAMQTASALFIGQLQLKYYSGRPGLKVQSGAARRWQQQTTIEESDIVSTIYPFPTAQKYIQAHDNSRGQTGFTGVIVPKKSKFLRFKIEGKWIFAKKVFLPIRTFVNEFYKSIGVEIFKRQIQKALKEILKEK
jgi:hypothetical protein